MGSGGTGGNNDTVQAEFMDSFNNAFLGISGTGKKIILNIEMKL